MTHGLEDVLAELVHRNNTGVSWYRMSQEIGCAPSTILRFIDQNHVRGPNFSTAEKMARYVGFELRYVRSNVMQRWPS